MSSILFEIKDAVAIIRLNRPEKFNSFNKEMALLLQKILDDCATDKNIRSIYLTGNGKAFCSGQDLAEAMDTTKISIQKIVKEHYNPIIKKIRTIEKPVVCGVNGIAAGAGANIALACDIVIASLFASFIQAFSKIGLIPDSGGTFTLPRLIGFQKASALMMLADRVSATEAERIGMIYKVFEDESFATDSLQIAILLSQMPTKALAYTKLALNASVHNSLEDQLKKEDELQFKAAHTADYAEGVAAFVEKRSPVFKGE